MKKIDEDVNTIIVKRAYAKRANLGSFTTLVCLFAAGRMHIMREIACVCSNLPKKIQSSLKVIDV